MERENSAVVLASSILLALVLTIQPKILLNWNLNTILPLVISVFSLSVSGFTLWFTHLRPFKLEITCSSPVLRQSHFKPPANKLRPGFSYIQDSVTIDFGLSFINVGSRLGKLENIRLTCKDSQGNLVFQTYDKVIVDYRVFRKVTRNSANYADAITQWWYPVFALPKKATLQHICMEVTSCSFRETGIYDFVFEYMESRHEDWEVSDSYELTIEGWMLDELNSGSPFMLPEAK